VSEQEGYRWREDDGTETTATWIDAQDTDIFRSKDTPMRLRTLTNYKSGDPTPRQFKLQWRKVGDPTWRDVP